jgi:hypothetical protein
MVDVNRAKSSRSRVRQQYPTIGNLLEYAIAEYLNETQVGPDKPIWIRQDPGFPDTVLSGGLVSNPGLAIKAWFPLSTEITARFRESQSVLQTHNVKVVVVCWVPEFIVAGRPKVIDTWIGNALDIAKARDVHYHNPPHYLGSVDI